MLEHPSDHPQVAGRARARYLAIATVTLLLLLTILAWHLTMRAAVEDGRQRFTRRVDDVDSSLQTRLVAYEHVLLGTLSLFRASNSVDRHEFATYVGGLALDVDYPGVQGVGYARVVAPSDLERFQAEIRASYPDFALKPPGPRELYTAIVYLEPFSGRNLRAFGFDMFSEPVRHAAMQIARDTGRASISGPVRLVQETTEKPQVGFLMYAAHYRGDPATTEARRATLEGYVYSPFRMRDFMEGLGSDRGDLAMTIYDGPTDAIMFDDESLRQRFGAGFRPAFEETRMVDVHGHPWRVVYHSRPTELAIPNAQHGLWVLAAGALIGGLCFATAWAFASVRKRAELLADRMAAARRDGELRLRAILDNAVDAILTVDDHGRIESGNPATHATFAHDQGALVGVPLTSLMAAEHRDTLEECLRSAAGKPSVRCDLVALRGGSDPFPAELTISPMKVGERFKFVCFVRDITDRQRVDRMKNEFISTVSHELRTPLTSIRGALGIIHAGEGSPKLKSLAEIALRNSERLVRLINDILNIEKIESGRYELTIEPHRLGGLLAQAIEANQAFAEQHGVRLELDRMADDVTVAVDADALSQVLTNLISNATKFSPREEHVRVSATATATGVRVSVTDHGRGIPPEFHGRIFQKFSQAEASDARVKGGTGLGLSISKALVERMGGSIAFASRLGEGTTFYFDLPIATAASGRHPSRAPTATSPRSAEGSAQRLG